MASLATLFSLSNPISSFCRASPFPNPPVLLHIPTSPPKQRRGTALVAHAGPTTNSILFAIALPTSLLAVTILAALKMGDKLDRDWLEEMAKNEALKEVEEDDDEDSNDNDDGVGEEDSVETSVQEEPALSRARNRPKREA